MQTIYKANHTSRFNFIGSDFCNAKIPSDAKNVLLYLIDKPLDWKLIVKNIANTLGLSVYAVRKALRWLLEHGYARYKRFTDGRTVWEIFEEGNQAATPVMTPRVEIPNVETQHDIHKTKTSPITQKTTTAVEPIQAQKESLPVEMPSVVVRDESKTEEQTIKPEPIPGIAQDQQKAARKVLAQLTPEQTTLVLSAFTLALSKHKVSSKIGYLVGLVKAMKDGTFTEVGAAGGAPLMTASERIAKERQRQQEQQARGKMSNEQYAEWLQRTYGGKAINVGKADGRISLKRALGW